MSEIAIKVQHLGKQYRLGGKQASYSTFRETLVNAATIPLQWLKGERKTDQNTFWALDDVSFEVNQGDAVGIIGRNGAGKSTLLKILSRITSPTRGRVDLYGRVGTLLEVGTGFHPELSGRENIYLNGAILGMSRIEIAQKFDEIVAFSEIERFLDTPVKHYSSGMYVRLAFAVAAHLEPEILVVDEVLAVGDAAFQKKCLGKMGEVSHEGRTVLFVSHQMDMIRSLCNKCILLNNGIITENGAVDNVVNRYIKDFIQLGQKTEFILERQQGITLQIISGRLIIDDGYNNFPIDVFSKISIEIEYILTKPINGAVVNIEIKRNGTTLLLSFDTDEDPDLLGDRSAGTYRTRINLPNPLLKPGNYSVSMNTGIINITTFQHIEDILSFSVELQSKPSSLLSYAEKRNGIIAVPMKWQTIKVSD